MRELERRLQKLEVDLGVRDCGYYHALVAASDPAREVEEGELRGTLAGSCPVCRLTLPVEVIETLYVAAGA